ncbi:MAG: DUF86 domain-containing protein [Candidatus Aureabacteria bacterium]|nr:DUF86 domain-containing protein [Candidatus Auribacterota bacterium]
MRKGDNVYIGHMLDKALLAMDKVRGKTRDEYDTDEDLRMITAYLVQTIGEAARRVSQKTRDAHPQIPWKRITGIRHRIVHDYMDVDYDIIWEVVTGRLPVLVEELKKILSAEEN